MQIHIKILIGSILLCGCSTNRYLLTDSGKDKTFLIASIKELAKKGEISHKPLIVIDGIPYRFDVELKDKRLPLSKKDIQQVDRLKEEVGMKIYGAYAKGGVLLITTKSYSIKKSQPVDLDKSRILILLDDKVISKSEMDKIDANEIESIDVVKDKEKVKQYTSENYDGVVVIHMKKRN